MDKKEILKILESAKDKNGDIPMKLVRQAFDKLPSAEPKTGEWIRDKKTEREKQLMFHKVWTCSKCGEQQCRPKPSNFCPNCGSKMGGKNETA